MSRKKGVSKRMLSRLKALRPGVLALRRRSLVARDFIKFEPVRIAFQELTLDPRNEADWQILATTLAISQFSESAGRPANWTLDRQIELLGLINERRDENPSLSVKQACTLIAKDKKAPNTFVNQRRAAFTRHTSEQEDNSPSALRNYCYDFLELQFGTTTK